MHKVTDLLTAYRKQFVLAASFLAAMLVIVAGYSLLKSVDERKAAPLLVVAYESYSPVGVAQADYRKALDLFKDVKKKYSRTMSAAIAQYYVGNCLANLGQADEALREYQNFINTYSGEKFLLGLVYQRMGYAYGALGRQAEAIKAFGQADALTGPGVATLELARLYQASGNIPESRNKYKVVQEKLGGTSWSMEAIGKVQIIEPAPKPAADKNAK